MTLAEAVERKACDLLGVGNWRVPMALSYALWIIQGAQHDRLRNQARSTVDYGTMLTHVNACAYARTQDREFDQKMSDLITFAINFERRIKG